MIKRKKILFYSLLSSLLIISLFSCSNNSLPNSSIHRYVTVGDSSLPTFDTDGYTSGITDDFDAEDFIDKNYGVYIETFISSYLTLAQTIKSLDTEGYTISSSKDISAELFFQIEDDNITITDDSDDTILVDLDIDWLDLYLSGASTDSLVDIYCDNPFETDLDFDLILSAEFSETLSENIDLISSTFIRLQFEDNSSVSGEIDLSYAFRLLNVSDNVYYNLSGELLVDEFNDLDEDDFDSIEDILNSSESDADKASDIQNVIWGDDEEHISCTLYVGDNSGIDGSVTYYFEDILPVLIILLS
ncbi:MAG: hypothetical protein ACPKM0_02845 [Pleomorphochaeta sp.]